MIRDYILIDPIYVFVKEWSIADFRLHLPNVVYNYKLVLYFDGIVLSMLSSWISGPNIIKLLGAYLGA